MAAGVARLLAVPVTQMALAIRQDSLTWDEAVHRGDEARAPWQTALALARKPEPGVREGRIRGLERRLGGR
jgi:hypothetical protein